MKLLHNFLTSGYVFSEDDNLQKFRFALLNILILIVSFFALLNYFASIVGFISLSDIFEKAILMYVFLNLTMTYVLRKNKSYFTLVTYIIIFSSLTLFYFALLTPKKDEFRLIWFFLILFAHFVLMGKKSGFILSVFILTCIFSIQIYQGLGLSRMSLFTFFNSFIIFTGFIYYFIEKIEKDAKELTRLNKTLKEEITITTQERNEKALLLQEVHHRVKNNLHIILSMIQLQQTDKHNESLLIDLENRINTIAKTYEVLIVNNHLDHIDMTPYILQLVNDIEESFSHLPCKVTLTTQIKATLPLKEAVYVGLIINELITNAYKYAFISNKGNIKIILTQTQQDYTLIVHDNGIGFNQETQKKSLGTQLIETLVKEQLLGEMHINSMKQTQYTIHFTLDS